MFAAAHVVFKVGKVPSERRGHQICPSQDHWLLRGGTDHVCLTSSAVREQEYRTLHTWLASGCYYIHKIHADSAHYFCIKVRYSIVTIRRFSSVYDLAPRLHAPARVQPGNKARLCFVELFS